ncbi:GNAT family N-acetyltransferase [Streptomyces sp. NPDC020141]|uniref:GNAT family N-acetyltransferase n=1 Tax=Streptomyces sp. NPDC020141 TaxID=3365065 RepID=UPI0037BD1E46
MGRVNRRGSGPVVPPTARLEPLPLRVAHAEEMAEVLADPRPHEFIGGEPDSVERLRSRYERMTAGSPRPNETWLNWVILLRDENRPVGTVQATIVDRVAGIARVVGVRGQGRGIAREAARALADSLARGPVETLVAHIHPDRHASASVARSAGLAPTGRRHDGEIRWERSR